VTKNLTLARGPKMAPPTEKEVIQGEAARRLIRDPLVQDLFSALEVIAVSDARNTDDATLQVKAVADLRALDRLRLALATIASRGATEENA